MSIVSVYCVFADAEEAQRIGRIVIEERFAACINIFAPCHSIYRWEGRVEEAREVPAVLKTGTATAHALVARLDQLHSYDVPAIVVWPVGHAPASYASWVEANTAPERLA